MGKCGECLWWLTDCGECYHFRDAKDPEKKGGEHWEPKVGNEPETKGGLDMANPSSAYEFTLSPELAEWAELNIRAEAIKTRVKGMEAENLVRKAQDQYPVYGEHEFGFEEVALIGIADQMKKFTERKKDRHGPRETSQRTHEERS